MKIQQYSVLWNFCLVIGIFGFLDVGSFSAEPLKHNEVQSVIRQAEEASKNGDIVRAVALMDSLYQKFPQNIEVFGAFGKIRHVDSRSGFQVPIFSKQVNGPIGLMRFSIRPAHWILLMCLPVFIVA